MSFLRPVTVAPMPELAGRRVTLRAPALADHAEWAALRARSRDFLMPWEPIWPADDLERAAFRRRIKRYAGEVRDGIAYPFFVCAAGSGELLGGVTLAQVRRGVTQSGTIGYWMGLPHAGRGLMTEAVGLLARWAFDELKLHRIEAACLPDNVPSIRLLQKVGFALEGQARRYLCIAGRWRDHLLWGLLADDPLYPPADRPEPVREPSAVGFGGRALVETGFHR